MPELSALWMLLALEVVGNCCPEAPVSEPINPTRPPRGADCFAQRFGAAWVKKQALSVWNFKNQLSNSHPSLETAQTPCFQERGTIHVVGGHPRSQRSALLCWMDLQRCRRRIPGSVPEPLMNTTLLMSGIPAAVTSSPLRLALFQRWEPTSLREAEQGVVELCWFPGGSAALLRVGADWKVNAAQTMHPRRKGRTMRYLYALLLPRHVGAVRG